MQYFRAAADSLGQFAKSCRFAVQINPANPTATKLPINDLIYMCDSVQYPGRGFDVTQIRYYGPSQAVPSNSTYEQVSMSFLCRTLSSERQYFDDWMDIINPTSTFNFEYPNNYYAEINIFQLAEWGGPPAATVPRDIPQYNGEPVATYGWTLRKAWPMLISPQQVTWADQDVLRLQVTFAYKYWDRPYVSK